MIDKNKLQTLKGFRDFLPGDAKKRDYLRNILRKTFETHGFDPIETPALEYKEVLLGKYGDEADKLVYTFRDKGDREVALRYDQTVPSARLLAMYSQQLPMPWRRYQMQHVWRSENPQKGRFREFLQSDADIYGSSSPLADAEVIALSNDIYERIGFTDFTIFINDRNILFQVLDYIAITSDLQLSVIQSIDKLDKKSQEEVGQELLSKGIDQKVIGHLFEHLKSTEPNENLRQIMKYAVSLGVPLERMVFQPGLARGLDYYTSTIFEVKIRGYEAGSVLGGGRYDKLINLLSGIDIPAVGFALGFDRTIEAINQFNLFPDSDKDNRCLVTVFNPDFTENSTAVVSLLRKNGISTELYPTDDAKLDKQLKYADKKSIKWLVVIGPEEAQKETVILKDLASGHQEDVKIKDLPDKFRQLK